MIHYQFSILARTSAFPTSEMMLVAAEHRACHGVDGGAVI